MNIILPEPKKGELYRGVIHELFFPKDKLIAVYLGHVGAEFCYEVERACQFCGINFKTLTAIPFKRPDLWEELQKDGFDGETVMIQPVKPVFDENLPHPYYNWIDCGDPIRIMSGTDLKKLFLFCSRHPLCPGDVKVFDGQILPSNSQKHCHAIALAMVSSDISLAYETRISFEKIDADLRFATLGIFHKKNSSAVSKTASPSKKVYVLGDLDRGVIKIGISENTSHRISSIQTGYPYPLTVLWSSPRATKNAHKKEQKLHRLLSDFRLSGEWFDAAAFQMIDWASLG